MSACPCRKYLISTYYITLEKESYKYFNIVSIQVASFNAIIYFYIIFLMNHNNNNIFCDNIIIVQCKLYIRIIKNILKNERVCRDIYQNRKSTGTRWLWQQNEIPLPHNNRT